MKRSLRIICAFLALFTLCLTTALAAEETPQVVIPGPGFVFAPVTEGANAGFAYVCLGEKSVGKIPVVYGQTVELPEEPPKKHFWDSWWKGEAS